MHRRLTLIVSHERFRWLAIPVALACAVGCAPQSAAPPASGATPNAAAAEPDPAAVGVVDRRGKGGASVFVAYRASDFDAFEKFFEAGAADREKLGVKGHLLTRLDGGGVVIHLFAQDLDALKLTLDVPALKEHLNHSDTTKVWLAYDEFVKLPAKPPTEQTHSQFFKLRLADLPALRRGFLQLQPRFAEYGVVASGLHHSVDQSDLAILHFVGTARDKLEALVKHPEFVEWFHASGVAGEPEGFIGSDVSRSRTYYDGF